MAVVSDAVAGDERPVDHRPLPLVELVASLGDPALAPAVDRHERRRT